MGAVTPCESGARSLREQSRQNESLEALHQVE
jgi:hypothetical protein